MSLLGGHFGTGPDPRRRYGQRHTLADLFAFTLGAVTFVAVEAFGHVQIDWLRRVIPLASGVRWASGADLSRDTLYASGVPS